MATVYELIEKARKTGKVEKGSNEVTKAIERGTAKLVAYGADVDPKEIVQHIPILCKEKGITCVEADKKEKLGVSVGLNVGCAAVAIIEAGDAAGDIEGFKVKNKEAEKGE
jgi:large subunit ribosomal protein L7Ae|tara:strand:+ start:324 stop:656 length:333 start_codon:yes stop_codon:yes gene_type:complete